MGKQIRTICYSAVGNRYGTLIFNKRIYFFYTGDTESELDLLDALFDLGALARGGFIPDERVAKAESILVSSCDGYASAFELDDITEKAFPTIGEALCALKLKNLREEHVSLWVFSTLLDATDNFFGHLVFCLDEGSVRNIREAKLFVRDANAQWMNLYTDNEFNTLINLYKVSWWIDPLPGRRVEEDEDYLIPAECTLPDCSEEVPQDDE